MAGAPHLVIAPCRVGGCLLLLAAAVPAGAAPRDRQEVPTIDTEDASLGSVTVGTGRVRAIATLDVRNGDYARGAYDDDDADLSRVPVHVALGFAAVLARDADGDGRLFLIGQSSQGLHAPSPAERCRPRIWYESNTIAALAWRPRKGLTAAAAYAVKASPNGVADTSHEASLSLAYDGDDGIGRWAPRAVVTARPKGGPGVFTLATVAPSLPLGTGERAPTLSFPLAAGIGWDGFYARGSGNRLYGSAGAALEVDVAEWITLRAEMLALFRDDRLRGLDAPGGTTAAVVPLGTLSLVVRG